MVEGSNDITLLANEMFWRGLLFLLDQKPDQVLSYQIASHRTQVPDPERVLRSSYDDAMMPWEVIHWYK